MTAEHNMFLLDLILLSLRLGEPLEYRIGHIGNMITGIKGMSDKQNQATLLR
jgi:hypothetical protein